MTWLTVMELPVSQMTTNMLDLS